MSASTAYCPACRHDVAVTLTDAPLHPGHANVPDAGELVCLDFGAGCSGERCPLSNMPRVVMALRLARSGMAGERMEHVRALCDACQRPSLMSMIDDGHGVCDACGQVNRVLVLEVDRKGPVAIAVEAMIAER